MATKCAARVHYTGTAGDIEPRPRGESRSCAHSLFTLSVLALIIVLLRTVMHAFITRTLPVSGVTGIAPHALSTRMMPLMWEVVLISAADGNGSVTKIAACRRISFPYNLLFAIFYHASKTEDTHPVGSPPYPHHHRPPPPLPVKWQ